MTRFIRSDYTVLDEKSGLEWTCDASPSEFPLTWNEAFSFIRDVNRSNLFGYDDWKLPSRKELFSLISLREINPALPAGHPFTGVFHGTYWTCTTCARLPDQAWYIHLGGAKVYRGLKSASYMVWPVRVFNNRKSSVLETDFSQEALRFEAKDDTVLDNATGLTWLKDAGFASDMMDLHSAFEKIEEMNDKKHLGFRDWRIPEISELETLTELTRHSPALPAGHPFTGVKEFYWSSTTSMYNTDYAWALYLRDGALGVGYKALPEFHLWPVRGNRENFKE